MEILRVFASEYPFYVISGLLIFLGIGLFILKRNLLVAILALEVVFNGINLLFVTASHYLGDPKGKNDCSFNPCHCSRFFCYRFNSCGQLLSAYKESLYGKINAFRGKG